MIEKPFIDVTHDEPGFAKLFAANWCDKTINVGGDEWRYYDGKVWIQQRRRRPTALVTDMLDEVEEIHSDAGKDELAKLTRQFRTCGHLENIASLAAADGMRIETDRLDADPYLINCQNGVLDLRTLELREHRSSDYMTQIVAVDYDPTAKCPTWLEQLGVYMESDDERIAFLQVQLGSSLFGAILAENIVFFEGDGRNGKSTVVQAAAGVLGTYVGTLPASALADEQVHTSSIGGLRGKRFVYSSEIDSKRTIQAPRLRSINGYEQMRVQGAMRGDFGDLTPTWKGPYLINGAPKIVGANHAMKARLYVVPFRVKLEKVTDMIRLDLKLVAAEGPGIFAWLVEGARKAIESNGVLPESKVIREATDAVFDANDLVVDFLDECCTKGDKLKVAPAEIYAAYAAYARVKRLQAKDVLGLKAFGDALEERGYPRRKSNGVRNHEGLELIATKTREHSMVLRR